jgi:hypothetical protein
LAREFLQRHGIHIDPKAEMPPRRPEASAEEPSVIDGNTAQKSEPVHVRNEGEPTSDQFLDEEAPTGIL